MNRWLRDLGLILALAGLWAVGGYFMGLALEIIGFDTYRLSIILASLNVIIGLLLFLFITKDPVADRIFFGRAESDDEGNPAVGCLWILPMFILLIGVSMWFWANVIRLIFPK